MTRNRLLASGGQGLATIYDVAREAGVSPKTVSRVLNGDAPVHQNTRARVEAAIVKLDFIRSHAARTMRSQRSGLIGIITGAISSSPSYGEPAGLPDIQIVQGAQRIFAQENLTTLISDTGGRQERVPELVQTLLEHRVEGLIYVAEYHQKVSFPKSTAATISFWSTAMTRRGRLPSCPTTSTGTTISSWG